MAELVPADSPVGRSTGASLPGQRLFFLAKTDKFQAIKIMVSPN